MNELKVFNNAEFGQIRTVEIEGKIYFVGIDATGALGYSNPHDALIKHCKNNGVAFCEVIDNMGRPQKTKCISEGNLYRLITHSKLESAERFESWVFDDVLPYIRHTGHYEMPNMSKELQAIIMIDKKQVQMEERMDKLEFDIPLYGAEADELSNHIKRKGVKVLKGKQSEAYKDTGIRTKVYRDIYDQVKREFGIYDDSGRPRSYKAMKRKYIADAHEFIDCYEAPTYLIELIETANAQMNLGVA